MSLDDVYRIYAQRWREGKLRGLLFDHQHKLYDHFKRSHARKEVWHCSRRIGKSVGLLTIGCEVGRTHYRQSIRYGAASQKDVREIILPLMKIITATCPLSIRPIWKPSENKFVFPETECEMVISGLDEGRADNLRGAAMKLGIIDEAGFIDDLDYVVKSVLMPQCLTTDGKILLASSSPRTPGHPFVGFIEEAQDHNAYVKMTIHEDSRPEVLARIPEWCEEAGGENSTTWRREYLCELITDEESSIIPEFTDSKEREIVQEWVRPPYFVPYTVADLGLIDYTGIVFGYVDYRAGRKVIEDEILINRKDSGTIAEMVHQKEKELWGDEAGDLLFKPHRYADAQLLNVHDFNILHKLDFVKVPPDTVEGYVNRLRLDIKQNRLVIHPRCKQTIRQLHHGIWNKAHTKFDRNVNYGHYDLLAAAMYFADQCDLRHDPYPQDYQISKQSHFVHPNKLKKNQHEGEIFKDIFSLNQKKKF